MPLDKLKELGYNLDFSLPCVVEKWGKWVVHFTNVNTSQVAGYGDDENLALEDALKTATKIK